MASTKLQPGKHETSTWRTRNFNLANMKLQHGKGEPSTWQTRNFNLANTTLEPGKHETSTWQTRNFNMANTKLQLGEHQTSTWQTRNLSPTNTNRFSCAIGASWDKMSRLEKFSGHCSGSVRIIVVARKLEFSSRCGSSNFRVTLATRKRFESL